jgi:glycosyltransferase involved in cell wall biosynthesis
MPRRILLLLTDLEIGGTPTVVRELALHLHRQGEMAVEVACLAGRGPVVVQLEAAGIAVTPLNARGCADLGVVGRLIRLIHHRSFDVVLSFLFHANAAAAAAKLFCPGVRFFQSMQTTQPQPAWHWDFQRFIHAAARRLVVPSPSVAAAAQALSGIPRRKIVVIPNALDPAEFSPSPAPMPDVHPFPIGFIGRLDPVKRLGDLLAAVEQLHGLVHLHVFGDGPQRGQLVAQSQRPGLTGRVTFYGAIPAPQPALGQIGILVLPSMYEGFGLVLIEAMAAGVPVVARKVPGVCDVVRDGQTGLLTDPADANALGAAISRLVGDPALRRRLIETARREVAQRFTWETVLPLYLSLFH